ncbi:MAG TPA: hypothetical protein V6C91_12065 [Coleofasciculaceae cyanobacterium]
MEQPFSLTFSNAQTAAVVRVCYPEDLSEKLNQIGLEGGRPVLVVVGGASQIGEAEYLRIKQLFIGILAPIAEKLGAYVVDGGTNAGVMELMGYARTQIAGTFPLIGVAPEGKVALPNQLATPADATPLEPHHTHFVLIPGSEWGDESPWIVRVATVLASSAPSVTVLLNGGEVTFKDAFQSVIAGRLVIVIAGSGRTADKIADALDGKATDERAKALADSGLVRDINLEEGFAQLDQAIQELLSVPNING